MSWWFDDNNSDGGEGEMEAKQGNKKVVETLKVFFSICQHSGSSRG